MNWWTWRTGGWPGTPGWGSGCAGGREQDLGEADGRLVAGSEREAKRRGVDMKVTVMLERSSWRRPMRRTKTGMCPRPRKRKSTTCMFCASPAAMVISLTGWLEVLRIRSMHKWIQSETSVSGLKFTVNWWISAMGLQKLVEGVTENWSPKDKDGPR